MPADGLLSQLSARFSKETPLPSVHDPCLVLNYPAVVATLSLNSVVHVAESVQTRWQNGHSAGPRSNLQRCKWRPLHATVSVGDTIVQATKGISIIPLMNVNKRRLTEGQQNFLLIRTIQWSSHWKWAMSNGLKDSIPEKLRKGVIYKVPCMECETVYIGEKLRKLDERLKEHKGTCRRRVRRGPWSQSMWSSLATKLRRTERRSLTMSRNGVQRKSMSRCTSKASALTASWWTEMEARPLAQFGIKPCNCTSHLA